MLQKDTKEISQELVQVLGISPKEADLYLSALRAGFIEVRSPASDASRAETVASLAARGMLIESSNGKGYLPVHPRLALSNVFRAQEGRPSPERKQRRLAVDRLTLELICMCETNEQSKSTNVPTARGDPNGRAQT